MAKLKCWKKQKGKFWNVPYTWVNKKESGIIEVSYDLGDALGNVSKYKVYSNRKGFYPKKFDTKEKAVKFANKYMKEHDKC